MGLLERHDPARGQVVVHPTPGARSLQAFAHDVLDARGRAVNRLDAEQLAGPAAAWRAVTAWMVTGQTRELVVLRADRLTASVWARVLELGREAGLEPLAAIRAEPGSGAGRRTREAAGGQVAGIAASPSSASPGPYPRSRLLVFPCETEITNGFSRSRPDGPLTAGNEKDAAKQTADGLPLYRFDLLGHLAIPDRQVISFSSHRTGKITAPTPGPGQGV